MQRDAITPGKQYAIRETGSASVQRVRIVEHARRDNWRAVWVEPNPGLEDFVRSRSILCEWAELGAVLRDEERLSTVQRHSDDAFPGEDHPVADAVRLVIDASGETSIWLHRGTLSGPSEAVDRLVSRSKFAQPSRDDQFVDRNGEWYGPWSTALALARAFAAEEPASVLLKVELEQREMEVRVRDPGNAHLLRLLERWRAAWAIVREWAGGDAEVSRLTSEVERLRSLIRQTVWELRRPDCDPERVSRQLDRRLIGK